MDSVVKATGNPPPPPLGSWQSSLTIIAPPQFLRTTAPEETTVQRTGRGSPSSVPLLRPSFSLSLYIPLSRYLYIYISISICLPLSRSPSMTISTEYHLREGYLSSIIGISLSLSPWGSAATAAGVTSYATRDVNVSSHFSPAPSALFPRAVAGPEVTLSLSLAPLLLRPMTREICMTTRDGTEDDNRKENGTGACNLLKVLRPLALRPM